MCEHDSQNENIKTHKVALKYFKVHFKYEMLYVECIHEVC